MISVDLHKYIFEMCFYFKYQKLYYDKLQIYILDFYKIYPSLACKIKHILGLFSLF